MLLSKGPMGEISVCSACCLHIDTPAISIRLTEPDFRMLVRMFSTTRGGGAAAAAPATRR